LLSIEKQLAKSCEYSPVVERRCFEYFVGMGTHAWPNLGCLQYAFNREKSQFWEKSIKFRRRYLLIGHTGDIKPYAQGKTKPPNLV